MNRPIEIAELREKNKELTERCKDLHNDRMTMVNERNLAWRNEKMLIAEREELTEANQKLGERAEQLITERDKAVAERDVYRELLTRAVNSLNEVTAERDKVPVKLTCTICGTEAPVEYFREATCIHCAEATDMQEDLSTGG